MGFPKGFRKNINFINQHIGVERRQDILEDIADNYEFWHEKTPEFFSSNYYLTYIQDISKHYGGNLTPITSIEDIKKVNRKAMKKWYEANQVVLNEIQLFKLWAEEHQEDCQVS